MAERRQIRTPFRVTKQNLGWEICAADGATVALVFSREHAEFIVRACNRHDDLMLATNLCKGHISGMNNPFATPTLKGLDEVFKRIDADILKHGR